MDRGTGWGPPAAAEASTPGAAPTPGYVEEPTRHELFDVVVIDGFRRNACSEVAARCLTDRGVIVWDNTDRAAHVYWVDATGLVRISHEANPGDPVDLIDPASAGADNLPPVELAQDADHVYVLRYSSAQDLFDDVYLAVRFRQRRPPRAPIVEHEGAFIDFREETRGHVIVRDGARHHQQ